MARLWVGTKKGLFLLASDRKQESGWRVESLQFLGSPVTALVADSGGNRLLAALALGHFGPKLHRSEDGGASWTEVAPPSYPPAEGDGEEAPAVSVLWSMAWSADGKTVWAGTLPGGLFRSEDLGGSWSLNRPLWDMEARKKWFGGGYDLPGIHSICLDPKDRKRISLAVSCGGVWESRDEGANWRARSKGMWAAYMPPEQKEDEATQDPHRMVQCRAKPDSFWVQHHNGIFRSTDDLASWQEIDAAPHSGFGFAVAVHPERPDTAWFVPAVKDELRVPKDGKFVVLRTDDGGQSFTVQDHGLPQPPAYDLVYRHGLAVDDEGQALAMGSTTGSLWTSGNGGQSWHSFSSHLPPITCLGFLPN